jgi:HTH-type transcriptional regulator / antitoxin HipB
LIVLTSAFQKKSQKTPIKEIPLAKNEKKNILAGGKQMDDLDKYIETRKNNSPNFIKNFEEGYEQFKIGVLLKQARLEAGFTQQEVANILNTKKSAISRIENHAEDIRLSTLVNYAHAVGKSLRLKVARSLRKHFSSEPPFLTTPATFPKALCGLF